MLSLLIAGVYSAYKHFSGLDPLKIDPKGLLTSLLKVKNSDQVLGVLSSIKVSEKIADKFPSQISGSKTETNPKPLFKFLLVSDSHSDNNNLKKAIVSAKQRFSDIQFIIGLGDYTNVGTLEEFKLAKNELDLSGLRYFLIPGDHDLWDSRDKQTDPLINFKQVFGPAYQSFVDGNFKFILLHNSDNYSGLDDDQLEWLDDQLQKAKEEKLQILIFLHEPLYHPSSDHIMGRFEPNVKKQAKNLIYQLKGAGVKKIFAGDIHYFSEYNEPETNLSMVTIGAVTVERNPQAPRFAIVWVYDDGLIKVEDVEIK